MATTPTLLSYVFQEFTPEEKAILLLAVGIAITAIAVKRLKNLEEV